MSKFAALIQKIRAVIERSDPNIGRVSLKSVSDDYLVRKGGKEYS